METTEKHSVLIVDDEPDILLSLNGLLRRDFQVFTAETGERALEIMQERPIHVVMTDQRMPSMTGVELMGRVRSEHPEAIRIIFTGYADTRAVVEAINTGGLYRYITKPWDPDDLIDVIREAANRYDAIVAQAELLRSMDSYLAETEKLVKASNDSPPTPDDLALFNARHIEIRSLLQRIAGSK